MYIKGLNNLENNNYKRITLNDRELVITGNSFKELDSNKELSNKLKNYTYDELETYIINYYLSSGNISLLDENYSRDTGMLKNNNEKELIFRRPLLKENALKILDKYLKDRIAFLEDNKGSNYIIDAFYGLSKYEKGNDFITFSLALDQNRNLLDMEMNFIEKVIGNIFIDEKINIEYNNEEALLSNLKLFSDNNSLSFRLPFNINNESDIIECITSVIKSHNNELSKRK